MEGGEEKKSQTDLLQDKITPDCVNISRS